MNKAELTKLYEKLYFHELDRREKISARQSTPLAAMVGLVAIVAFLLNNKPVFQSIYLSATFWLTLGAAVVCLVIGAWHFRCSWLKHNERHVATAAEIDLYLNQLQDHHASDPNAQALIDRSFAEFLLDTYRRSATTNAENNDARSNSLHSAGTWMTFAVSLALISTIPYYLGRSPTHVGQETNATSSATAATAP